MVAEGRLDANGLFVADNILAKHDERYMPPQMGRRGRPPGDASDDRRSGGLAALWLAAALPRCSWRWRCGLAGGEQGRGSPTIRGVALARACSDLFAFGALIAVFLHTDLSVLLVAENSHSEKPWIYKFAGAWGNHEGSMLLWVTVLALSGAVSPCSNAGSTSAR